MCLIAFSYKNHPVYDLIFAANRDEFYERPTRPARFWEEKPDLLAGKDLKEGGTWLGITRSGDFAALTNFRDPSITRNNTTSRGHIVLEYLENNQAVNNFLQKLDREAERFNGFNLLAGTMDRLMYYSNQEREIKQVGPGIYGLSNHLLDTPWPKVKRAKSEMESIIQEETINEEDLFRLLENDNRAPDHELPETGIPKEWEQAVSSIFIKTDTYGTRCSTVLLVDKSKKATFIERRFKPGTTEEVETNRFEFSIEK